MLELIMVILIMVTLSYMAMPLFTASNSNVERNIFKVQLEETLTNAKRAAETSVDNAKVKYEDKTFTITLENDLLYEEKIEVSKNVSLSMTLNEFTITPKGNILELADGDKIECDYKLRNETGIKVYIHKYLDVVY